MKNKSTLEVLLDNWWAVVLIIAAIAGAISELGLLDYIFK